MKNGGGPELQAAIKRQGANASEIMTMINAESSVKKTTGNGYAQITPSAWKQAEKSLGRKLNRNDKNDYADATVAYYKWTARQVQQVIRSGGTPAVKDVYIAYNAGINGFKALYKASPIQRAIDVVPKEVSDNNPHFYYNVDGSPRTVANTLKTYRAFIAAKGNEYYGNSTKLALNSARH